MRFPGFSLCLFRIILKPFAGDPKVVEILIISIELRVVDHLATGTPMGQFGEGATSCLVVVQKGMDRRMPIEERERLWQIDHRVQ